MLGSRLALKSGKKKKKELGSCEDELFENKPIFENHLFGYEYQSSTWG